MSDCMLGVIIRCSCLMISVWVMTCIAFRSIYLIDARVVFVYL